jgi:hypothetical protein
MLARACRACFFRIQIYSLFNKSYAGARAMSLFKGAEGSGLRQNDNAFCNNEGDPDFRQDRNP